MTADAPFNFFILRENRDSAAACCDDNLSGIEKKTDGVDLYDILRLRAATIRR